MDGFGFHWVEFGGISVGLYENTMTSVDQRWIKMFFFEKIAEISKRSPKGLESK